MRRVVYFGALVTTVALFAAPVSAQTLNIPSSDREGAWHVNATLGPSFGTLGTTPSAATSAGYDLGRGWSFVGEIGTFRNAPLDNATTIAPPVSPTAPASDVKVNAYHTNFNVHYRLPEARRLSPYVTAGVGAFMAATPAEWALGLNTPTFEHKTHAAMNLGAGVNYRLNRWLGISADYRHFMFNTNQAQRVNRFTTGLSVSFK